MNCTEQYFRDTIFNMDPTYWIRSFNYQQGYFYAHHDSAQALFYQANSIQERIDKSSIVLHNGKIIKDTIGLFIPLPGSLFTSGTYTIRNSGRYVLTGSNAAFTLPDPATSPGPITFKLTNPKVKVCECGKEKHGFAKHANWCDLGKDQT